MNRKLLTTGVLVLSLFAVLLIALRPSDSTAQAPNRVYLPTVSRLPPIEISAISYMIKSNRYNSTSYAVGELQNLTSTEAYTVALRVFLVKPGDTSTRQVIVTPKASVLHPRQVLPFVVELQTPNEQVTQVSFASVQKVDAATSTILTVTPIKVGCDRTFPEDFASVQFSVQNKLQIPISNVVISIWRIENGRADVSEGYITETLLPGQEVTKSLLLGYCTFKYPQSTPTYTLEEVKFNAEGVTSP